MSATATQRKKNKKYRASKQIVFPRGVRIVQTLNLSAGYLRSLHDIFRRTRIRGPHASQPQSWWEGGLTRTPPVLRVNRRTTEDGYYQILTIIYFTNIKVGDAG